MKIQTLFESNNKIKSKTAENIYKKKRKSLKSFTKKISKQINFTCFYLLFLFICFLSNFIKYTSKKDIFFLQD